MNTEKAKERFQKEEFQKEDLQKEDFPKEDVQKEDVQKEDFQKEDFQKEDFQKEDFQKKDFPKENFEKENFQKEDFPKETFQKEEFQKRIRKEKFQRTKSERALAKKSPELPYERFFRFGAENLTEAELLAIIIRVGTKGQNALDLAKKVLSLARYPKDGLLGLYDVTLEELKSIGGIGEVKAVQLKCLAELSMRMSVAKARKGLNFTNPRQVADYFMEKLRHRATECVILVCLDTKGQMICEKKISEGSVNMSLISPREIFLTALEVRAVSILLVHNHPSGDPAPSRSDKELTWNVRDAGDSMGIPLLDHIVIGDRCYASFNSCGWFQE